MDTDRQGARCSFCGSPQEPPERTPDLKLVASSDDWTLDVGEMLRSARIARGETLEQASRFTRIRLPYLRDLEADDISSFDTYPGRVYARFFLREYADHLGLDPQPLVHRFDRDAEPVLQPAPKIRISRRTPHPRRWAVGALILLVAILSASALVSYEGRPPLAPVAADSGVIPAAPPSGAAHPTPPTHATAPTGIEVVIRTTLPCWILAVADGTIVMENTVPADETIRLHASKTMELRLGNAGGVALRVNGRTVPTDQAANVQDLSLSRRGDRIVIA
jgi:hypothetical protein